MLGAVLVGVAALLFGVAWAGSGWSDGLGGPERLTATLEQEGGRMPGTRRIQVTIDIVTTTPLEVAKLLAALVSTGGQPALQAVLDKYSNGLLSFGVLQYPLNLVVKKPGNRGERYVIVTNRPFSAYEVNTGQDSVNYPFGVVVFDVDDRGRGEGTVFSRAQITVHDDGTVDVNGYGEPGRLLSVSRQ